MYTPTHNGIAQDGTPVERRDVSRCSYRVGICENIENPSLNIFGAYGGANLRFSFWPHSCVSTVSFTVGAGHLVTPCV